MRLTTKGRFAVTAMIDVAMHGGKGPVTLAAVSERQHISLSYLEQLFGKLRRHGLVDSVRGPGGGYNLARAADAVSVADIILAVDEPIDATQCGGRENCHDDRRCMTHDLWAALNDHIFSLPARRDARASWCTQQQDRRKSRCCRTIAPVRSSHRRQDAGDCRMANRSLTPRPMPDPTDAMKLPIYLDYSATTPVDPRVAQKMIPYLTERFRQPGVALAFVRLEGGSGGRGSARARRGAGQLRPEGTRVDVGRDRVDQPRAQGRGALLQGQGQAPRHGQDRAQGDARHDARARARRLRGHLSRRARTTACSTSRRSRRRCGRTRSWCR